MSPRNTLHVCPGRYVGSYKKYVKGGVPWANPGNLTLPPFHLEPDLVSNLNMDGDQNFQSDQDQATEADPDHDAIPNAGQATHFLHDDHVPNMPGGGLNNGGVPQIGSGLGGGEVGDEGGQGGEIDEWEDFEDFDDFDDHEDDEDDEDAEDDDLPPIAPYRINLTALSQRYNIYAVAYRNVIHIFRVRSCIHSALPTRSDLVLRPPITQEALGVGGYISNNMPHQMNHLIMGDLGGEEILLLACDDGDVLGYYNFQIEKALSLLECGDALRKSATVEPFFHQNVGISAWGLAIHKKSRLIAVGNNFHEVHVFALALRDRPRVNPGRNTEALYEPELFPRLVRGPEGTMVSMSKTLASKIESNTGIPLSFQREHGCRIILRTGERGSNIPNVAFANDADGDAVKVLAVDILGNLWVLDIWSLHPTPHQCVESLYKVHQKSQLSHIPAHRVPPIVPQGWGVLVLPQSSFLPTSNFQDALGLSPEEAAYVQNDEYGCYIGTEKAVNHITNNSALHPWVRKNLSNWFEAPPEWHPVNTLGEWYNRKRDYKKWWNSAQDEAADNSSEHVPISPQNNNEGSNRVILPDGSTVMRTYAMDVELVGSDLDVGIMFRNVIWQKKTREALPPNIHFPPERLANLLHVPELSLVVAGSLCGRVALITLTRPVNPRYSFKHGFKVEAILPQETDENLNLRPVSLLLGVAIGPIIPTGGDHHSLGELRYRILLHYYDHTILGYEVYRNVLTEELLVV